MFLSSTNAINFIHGILIITQLIIFSPWSNLDLLNNEVIIQIKNDISVHSRYHLLMLFGWSNTDIT